ncbi:MAG: cobyrinate a,c-diamide synthase [Nitrososphaerota archaeon]
MVTLPPLLIIAGTTSGVGKTTISLAVMYAFKNKKGLLVQPFKIGPDFIDPSYHKIITGKESRTLDAWLMGDNGILSSVEKATKDVDIGIVEGVMGLFDGMSGKNDFASTAYVAKILNAPIILVVDAAKAARSIAAMICGYLNFDKKLKIMGIILNNVSGPKHAKYLIEACRNSLNVPILGIVERDNDLKMDERHLGLIPSDELEQSKRNKIVRLANKVSEEIYYDKILSLIKLRKDKLAKPISGYERKTPKLVTIAVALDNSFNFYYNENLNILRDLGAEITYFSPINDEHIASDISGMVLGGGFPEVMADKLNSNQSMLKSIKKVAEQGIPIYGECGGLMYLTKSITGYKSSKKHFQMVGIIDAKTEMTGRLTLNYTNADMNTSTFGNIKNMRGHEFHYSKLKDLPSDLKYAYSMKRGIGIDGGKHDGILIHNSIASYMHLHFHDRRFPSRWINSCIAYERK